MAILLAESFDGYANLTALTTANATLANSGTTYSTTGGRWGGGAIRQNSLNSNGITYPMLSPGSNLLRFAFHYRTAAFTAFSDSQPTWLIRFANAALDRFLSVRIVGSQLNEQGDTGTSGTYVGVSMFDDINTDTVNLAGAHFSAPIANGTWHHIEVEFVAHATTGSLKIWVDGKLGWDRSGYDTSDAASGDVTGFNQVRICGSNTSTGTPDHFIDDFLVWDDTGTDFTGPLETEHRMRAILVNAAGDSTQFTPNTGSNFQAVDEATYDDDTTYVESTTVGHIDLYNVDTFPETPGLIRGVLVETIAKDTGATQTHRELLKSNATVANGTTHGALTAAYRKYQSFYSKDPNGNIDWAQAAVEAAQVGQEVMS